MTKLFTPIEIEKITLKNRIVMSPMCMYSAVNKDGKLTPFHRTHYTARAIGQVGLIMVEATAIDPAGRISEQDLGIWDDQHIGGFKELNKQLHSYGARTAIQLAHAGRKSQVPPPIFAPSNTSFTEDFERPEAMTIAKINQTIQSFQEGAERAKNSDFDIIEIHAAHGYLINQFLSPLVNKRTDEYGGDRENRYRFLEEIINAIQVVWKGTLFVRISTDEYDPKGNTFADILYFSKRMKEQGVTLIDCSSGGVVPASIQTFPGYQVKRCEVIKDQLQIRTGAVGCITSGLQAEEILQNKRADLIFIGRSLLKNPHWAKMAADELTFDLKAPQQYKRGWG